MILCGLATVATRAQAQPNPVALDEKSTAFNTAIVPYPKIDPDNYDWYKRHAAVLAIKDTIHPQIVLIGDSITHRWGGLPHDLPSAGPKAWNAAFAGVSVLNLGFGYDHTQTVLWRLDHGEFAGLTPKWVVINIGTNNIIPSQHARANTPPEIAAAVMAICARVHALSPQSHLILMGLFPRGEKPGDPRRASVKAVNALLAADVTGHPEITYLDIGAGFLQPDGTLPHAMMWDGTHPTDLGYGVWAKALFACFHASN